jgi:hypothetical protein
MPMPVSITHTSIFIRSRIQSFDADSPFFPGELDAVLDQVPKNLLQPCWIAFHVRVNRAKCKVHFEVFCLDFVHGISRKRAGGFDGWK